MWRHLHAVEADDQQLADFVDFGACSRNYHRKFFLLLSTLGGQLSFFSYASRFNASSGVSPFRSTSRSFSSTGCEIGVKIVNCVGGGDAPGDRCSVSSRSADSCSVNTSRARAITSFGSPASLATSMP